MSQTTEHTSRETTVEFTVEEKTDRFLEIESQFQQQFEEQQTDDETDSELTEDSETDSETTTEHFNISSLSARVEDVEVIGDYDELQFTLRRSNGDTFTDSVRWPDDPTDTTEPLVRLFNWYDHDLREFADIGPEQLEFPIRYTDSENTAYELHIPPIPAPGNNAVYRLNRGLTNLGVYTENSENGGYKFNPLLAFGLVYTVPPTATWVCFKLVVHFDSMPTADKTLLEIALPAIAVILSATGFALSAFITLVVLYGTLAEIVRPGIKAGLRRIYDALFPSE